MSTVVTKTAKNIRTTGQIFQVQPDLTLLQFLKNETTNTIEPSNLCVQGVPGHAGVPLRMELRAVRTSKTTKIHPLIVTGFIFNVCIEDKTASSWLLDPYYGFIPNSYAPSYWSGEHKNICKKYRAREKTKNSGLV